MPIEDAIERELKLSAPSGFRLPELPGEALLDRSFSSTYFDTADHRLAYEGVTLRRRVENRRGTWQLKLPRGVARLELEVAVGSREPPAELVALLPAYARGDALAPAVTLRTKRSGVRTSLEAGAVAEVTVDVVTARSGSRSLGTFREIEAELVDGDEKGLRRIEKALRAAGAGDGDGRPKALRALGLTPRPLAPQPGRKDPAGVHIAAMLEAQYRAIVAHDPGTRLGRDPEELHQMRVATRRLRAFLRAARPALDRAWAASLREELAWIGRALGPVRDLDVLVEHLEADAESLETRERRALGRVFHHLELEREAARRVLVEALEGDRYVAALDRLEREVAAPPLVPAETSLAGIAAKEFRRLHKSARHIRADASDDELHELRIVGKRARYAAELAERTVGKAATRFIRDIKGLQDVLGEHQDASVAEQRLRALLEELRGPATAFAVGRLVERQRDRKRAARAAFPAAWKRVARQGREAWS